MSRSELASAADRLESAAGSATDGDATARLGELADQLDRLASADHGPDHGRLARIQSGLDQVQATVGDDTAVMIEQALDDIRAYRETLEGV